MVVLIHNASVFTVACAVNLMIAISAHAEPTSQVDFPVSSLQTKHPLTVRLEVNLTTRQVTVYQGAQKLKQYPIAIGRVGWETPQGGFKVNQVVRDPVWMNPLTGNIIPSRHPQNPLGRHWIGFLSETNIWYGFHGNNDPKSIGQAVSHGCIRMHNADVEDLMRQVEIGTEVRIFQ
jgi:lipoprotein-anchoring transpeptidase ErfK/SrfK